MIPQDQKRPITTVMGGARRSPQETVLEKRAKAKSQMDNKHEVMQKLADSEPDPDEVFVDGRHIAANDLMKAIDEKSLHKVTEALKNFIDVHNHQSSTHESS